MTVNIDDPAFVHPSAKIGKNVSIGRFSHIGPHVILLDNVTVMPNVYIDGHTTVEKGCILYPFASIGAPCQDLKYRGERTFVKIGPHTTIRESVTINSATGEDESTTVGSNCLVMAYSHVAHNCVVGDHVIMANGSTLAGHVSIGDYAIIGGLTAIHQFTRIGSYSIIGGCSKVVQDIPPFMMADGHPTKIHSINAIGLKRHGFSEQARKNIKKAYKIFFRSGLNTKHALEKISSELPSDSDEIRTFVSFIENSTRGISK
ncbi:MAG: acyl-ACP--UDP-N-acetylglucosamine O-acyltransferase [Candidatus Aureabacteria bacterium]|nr:acyl-ACP--UDP-N-acetylglucosamine O-acyltransferase [Candidatus Auribacterota bacterium]